MNKKTILKTINNRGFTLIELMVVIVILGILAGVIAPRLVGRTYDAQLGKAKADIVSLETALQLYRVDNGAYPTTEQGLMALVEAPASGTVPKNWRKGGYLQKGKVPKDPWGNEYIYLSPGVHNQDYDIVSYGADGAAEGEDENKDINSWDIE